MRSGNKKAAQDIHFRKRLLERTGLYIERYEVDILIDQIIKKQAIHLEDQSLRVKIKGVRYKNTWLVVVYDRIRRSLVTILPETSFFYQELNAMDHNSTPDFITYNKKVLHLHVKKQYFDEVKSGKKRSEYRIVCDYWKKQIEGMQFDLIAYHFAYPKKDDLTATIYLKWNGYEKGYVRHPHFGRETKFVYIIDVSEQYAV
jgi:ASC-1-like (ASCH) protein